MATMFFENVMKAAKLIENMYRQPNGDKKTKSKKVEMTKQKFDIVESGGVGSR